MTTSVQKFIRSFLAAIVLTIVAVNCSPGPKPGEIRGVSQGMRFTIVAESLPPHAMDKVKYTITVRDAKTGQPIEGGQGQIFATNSARHNTGDGFAPAPQQGTYNGTMMFINADTWRMAIEFRRDSVSPFGRIDWTQEVHPPRPMGG